MALGHATLTSDQYPYQRDRSVNATGSFPSRIPTTTVPATVVPQTVTSQDVYDLAATGIKPVSARIIPFGTGSATQTFSVRVIGWTDAQPTFGTSSAVLWVPTILCEYLCTLSTAVGVAGSAVLDTERFVDTLSLVANRGTDGQDTTRLSPTGNLLANFVVNLRGSKMIELCYSVGTNTDCNALVQFI
jgi:hypothetical protein